MSPSSASPDRPAEPDPYACFRARGVSREALREFFEAEVERAVDAVRVEGSPIAELYRLLGLDWTVTLIASHGGAEIYVPWSAQAAVDKWPELPAALSEVLADRHGGGTIAVPSLRRLYAACRRKLMVQHIASGLSYNAVAREFGVTARHVRCVVVDALTPGKPRARKPTPIALAAKPCHAEIMRRHARGQSAATIASATGLSVSQVRHIIRRAERRAEAAAPC